MEDTQEPLAIAPLLRLAVACAVIGLLCILLFLWRGFTVWSLGVGVFLGIPLLTLAFVLYIIAVVRDLRQQGIL